ncbi:glycosyltransferase family 4 protein [Candidatus Omnitrophota bacterium]
MNVIFLFLFGFILSFLLTPLTRRFCLKFGFLDNPQRRKIHKKPLPRLGGIAVIISFMAVLSYAMFFYRDFYELFSPRFSGVLIALILLIILGLWDDIKGIRPLIKLSGQMVVALVLFHYGFRIELLTNPFNGQEVQIPFLLSMFFSVFWVLGMINAINLIDGIDGLAPGIVFISAASLLFVGLYLKTLVSVTILSILCGSTLGFLYYNFPPAKIFLGDTGSMFLGFILAVTGLAGLQYKIVTATALIIPICALAIPISDVFLVIYRRLIRKGSIFIADKKHLHHRLLDLGLTQRQIVSALYMAAVYFGIIAFLFVLIPNQYALLLLLLLGIGIYLAVRAIGFIERRTVTLRRYRKIASR